MEPLHTVSGASGAPVVIGDEEEVKQEIIRVRAANVELTLELAKVNAELEELRKQLADRQAGPGDSGGSDGVNPGGGLPEWYDPAKHVIDSKEHYELLKQTNKELGDENKELVETVEALRNVVMQRNATVERQQEEIRKLKEHANSIVKVIAEGKAIADRIPERELQKIDPSTYGLDGLEGNGDEDILELLRKQLEEEEGKQQSEVHAAKERIKELEGELETTTQALDKMKTTIDEICAEPIEGVHKAKIPPMPEIDLFL